jgi:hypothetical protein
MNRPARWLVAAVEVAAATGLVVLTAWAWHRASITVELPEYENPAVPRTVNRMSGPWVAAAFAAATGTGVLMLDAIRRVLSTPALREDVGSPR